MYPGPSTEPLGSPQTLLGGPAPSRFFSNPLPHPAFLECVPDNNMDSWTWYVFTYQGAMALGKMTKWKFNFVSGTPYDLRPTFKYTVANWFWYNWIISMLLKHDWKSLFQIENMTNLLSKWVTAFWKWISPIAINCVLAVLTHLFDAFSHFF